MKQRGHGPRVPSRACRPQGRIERQLDARRAEERRRQLQHRSQDGGLSGTRGAHKARAANQCAGLHAALRPQQQPGHKARLAAHRVAPTPANVQRRHQRRIGRRAATASVHGPRACQYEDLLLQVNGKCIEPGAARSAAEPLDAMPAWSGRVPSPHGPRPGELQIQYE
eukprot:350494-Chlamydomonas_euryale.AAC.3